MQLVARVYMTVSVVTELAEKLENVLSDNKNLSEEDEQDGTPLN